MAAHEELTELARRRSELDGLEGPALLRAFRAGVHRHLGLGSFAEYVERLFGYSRRTLDDKLRTAEALEELPELTRSLKEGALSWSAVRELARVATPETETEWSAVARGRSVHELERLVSGRRRGARPGDAPEAGQQRHTLRFDVSAETFATFREAMKALGQRSDGVLDDDSALLLMAREVLGGPLDAGRSSYQVGQHDEENLIVLCSAHHRALHRGQLEIARRVSGGLAFRRADGACYGVLDVPRAADACERAFCGLRALGFGEREARRAVERSGSSGETETVLRRALSLLTDRAMPP